VFFDAGDAFDGSPDLRRSVGVGFRWRSPVGMFRFDIAHPLTDSVDAYRIHVTIGAAL
jgi:translocation and assembly module TamA